MEEILAKLYEVTTEGRMKEERKRDVLLHRQSCILRENPSQKSSQKSSPSERPKTLKRRLRWDGIRTGSQSSSIDRSGLAVTSSTADPGFTFPPKL